MIPLRTLTYLYCRTLLKWDYTNTWVARSQYHFSSSCVLSSTLLVRLHSICMPFSFSLIWFSALGFNIVTLLFLLVNESLEKFLKFRCYHINGNFVNLTLFLYRWTLNPVLIVHTKQTQTSNRSYHFMAYLSFFWIFYIEIVHYSNRCLIITHCYLWMLLSLGNFPSWNCKCRCSFPL